MAQYKFKKVFVMSKILEAPPALFSTKEEEEKYNEIKEYCKKYFYVFSLIYSNPYFGSFFFGKRKKFQEKMDMLYALSERKKDIFKYKVAQAIAGGKYSENKYQYTFWVDGKSHTFNVNEVDPAIFETAHFLKEEKARKMESNVVSIFKNK